MSLHKAIIEGDQEAIREILDREPAASNEISPAGGFTGVAPLHLAVKYRQLNTVALLVEKGADLEMKDFEHNASLLGWTAFYGNAEMARYLIELGADVNHECDPIHIAVHGRDGEWREFTSTTPEDYQAVIDVLKAHGASDPH